VQKGGGLEGLEKEKENGKRADLEGKRKALLFGRGRGAASKKGKRPRSWPERKLAPRGTDQHQGGGSHKGRGVRDFTGGGGGEKKGGGGPGESLLIMRKKKGKRGGGKLGKTKKKKKKGKRGERLLRLPEDLSQ